MLADGHKKPDKQAFGKILQRLPVNPPVLTASIGWLDDTAIIAKGLNNITPKLPAVPVLADKVSDFTARTPVSPGARGIKYILPGFRSPVAAEKGKDNKGLICSDIPF